MHKCCSYAILMLFGFGLQAHSVWAIEIVQFKAHTVGLQGLPVYQVRAVDMNGDGLLDILPVSPYFEKSVLSWYENPGWQQHQISAETRPIGLWTAAQDIDGDQIPELALIGGFNPLGIDKSSGELYLLEHHGSPTAAWSDLLFDQLPMSHRMEFIDVDGNGDWLLVVAPIVGGPAASLEVYPGITPLVYYTPDGREKGAIKSDIVGYVHGMIVVDFDDAPGGEVLTAGLQGVWLHKPRRQDGRLSWSSELLVPGFSGTDEFDRGASDVRVGKLADGRRFLVTVEPFHGGSAFVYLQAAAGWTRHQIEDELTHIHAVAVGDLNADGTDEIIIGNRTDNFATYVYYATDTTATGWQRHILDDSMGGTNCNVADFNLDHRLDIVCGGHYSENLLWYENLGK